MPAAIGQLPLLLQISCTTTKNQRKCQFLKLTELVGCEGIPKHWLTPPSLSESSSNDDGRSALQQMKTGNIRSLLWKWMLGVGIMESGLYVLRCDQGASPVHDKINKDSNRTFMHDVEFAMKVQEFQLTRLLNAVAWHRHRHQPSTALIPFLYVQGMNVLAGMALFVTGSELDAFYLVVKMVETVCPLYVLPNLDGVRCGCYLMDSILQTIDAPLFTHLQKCGLSAEIYGFACLTCVPIPT